MTGRHHISFMDFPAKIPVTMENAGLIAKNNSSVTAIPASLWTNVTAAHGSKSITLRNLCASVA